MLNICMECQIQTSSCNTTIHKWMEKSWYIEEELDSETGQLVSNLRSRDCDDNVVDDDDDVLRPLSVLRFLCPDSNTVVQTFITIMFLKKLEL